MQLNEFRTEVQVRLAESSIGTATFFTTTILNDWINQAEREIARRARAYERMTSFASTAGINWLRVPTDFFQPKSVSYINSNVEYPLTYVDIRQARSLYNLATQTTIPVFFSVYEHVRSHQIIHIFPKPSTTFTPIVAPGAPTLAEAAGGSLDSTGVYGYRVTLYNEWGETDGGTTASITLTGTNRTVSLSSIPTTTDTNVVGRRIYRTEGGGSVYFYVTQIADRSTTTTYTDALADTSLGPEIIGENTANNIKLYYYAIPGTALSADADTPRIPQPDYDQALIDYVMHLAMIRYGNPRDAQLWLSLFEAETDRITGDTDSKHHAHFLNVYDNATSSRGSGSYPFSWPIPSTNANS